MSPILIWNQAHSVGLISAAGFFASGASIWTLSLTASISFLVLIAAIPHQGTKMNLANSVTFIRLGAIVSLPQLMPFGPVVLVLLCAGIAALDGLDGWIARATGTTSEFGEYFDKESDALFLLMLGAIAYTMGSLGLWILLPCILRYAFVLLLAMVPPEKANKEKRTWLGRSIAVAMIGSLVLCLLPWPGAHYPAMVTSMLLAYSFCKSISHLYTVAAK